jgi:hypothetical protein
MATVKLYEGVWVRQVLKGKRTVRVVYVPDDVTQQPQFTKLSIDDDSKSAWKKLLGVGNSVDINLGIILVRFNNDNKGGTATFLPNQSAEDVIVKSFQQSDPQNDFPGVGMAEFLGCIQGKRDALGAAFDYPRAFAECLSQLPT